MSKVVKRLPRWAAFAAVITLTVAASTLAWGEQPTLAQGFARPSIDAQAFNACTTTDYTSIAAKALNITPVVLRKNIVSGQALQQIATASNVDLQTVVDAVQTARKADIDQAVKDGVLTQAEATTMEAPAALPATRPAPGNGNGGGQGGGQGGGRGGGQGGPGGFNPAAVFPDISTFSLLLRAGAAGGAATQPAPGNGPRGGGGPGGFGGGFGALGAGTFNLVKQYAVAAQPLNMKCPDLVKTLITPPGKSITALATAQKVDPATVSAALTKAYQDALAQDVKDGIITQAQSDQLSTNLANAVNAFVNNPLPMGPQGTPAAQG